MTAYYPNKEYTDKALGLMRVLGEMPQYEFGWILSGMMHRVQHPNPEYRQEAQRRVDCAVQGILVVYLFSIFDEYTTDQMRGEWIKEEDKKLLQVYRHIRNSVAHGHGGSRAKNCRWRKEFEDNMNSDSPLPGVIWDRIADTIDLTNSGVANSCHLFMSGVAQRLAGHLANDNRPARASQETP
ncbi:hypothetical protein [Inhella sp.]|uniref:hypothetical protein n=1 Tax=Inhella sp. TaxID=1921806 RepID=UPI0035B1D745